MMMVMKVLCCQTVYRLFADQRVLLDKITGTVCTCVASCLNLNKRSNFSDLRPHHFHSSSVVFLWRRPWTFSPANRCLVNGSPQLLPDSAHICLLWLIGPFAGQVVVVNPFSSQIPQTLKQKSRTDLLNALVPVSVPLGSVSFVAGASRSNLRLDQSGW